MNKILLIALLLLSMQVQAQPNYSNLEIYTRVYCLSKYFYPPSHYNKLDLESFVVHSLPKLSTSNNLDDLQQSLQDIFSVINPHGLLIRTGQPDTLKSYFLKTYIKKQKASELSYWVFYGCALNPDGKYFEELFGKGDDIWRKELRKLPASAVDTSYIHLEHLKDDLYYLMPVATLGNYKIKLPKKVYPSISKDTSMTDVNKRFLILVEMYGVMRHFYPYQEEITINQWQEVLITHLKKASEAKDRQALTKVMMLFLATFKDGHGNIFDMSYNNNKVYRFSTFDLDCVENKYIVTKIDSVYHKDLSLGDEIISINGKLTQELVEEAKLYISSATEGRTMAIINYILPELIYTDTLAIIFRNQEGQKRECKAKGIKNDVVYEQPKYAIQEFESNIYYVNLLVVDSIEFKEYMPKLQKATGIIFDYRHYYSKIDISETILPYFINQSVKPAPFYKPKVVNPNFKNEEYILEDWEVSPSKVKIDDIPLVFLTGSECISACETDLEIIKNYKIATIIGQNTAGTNGNIQVIQLPFDFGVMYTQLKVLQRDGSPFMGVGVKPDIQVRPTIEDIRQKKDRVLEEAIKFLNEKAKR